MKCENPTCNNEVKHKKAKTCSRECSNAIKKAKTWETRKCKVCEAEFEVKKKNPKQMCSDICRKKWGSMPENKENRLKKAEEAVVKKHGVKSTLLLDSVKKKIKETKIDKYGDENYNNHSKSKETKLEKYGDSNYNNHQKSKETKKEKYGDENYNNREKSKNTMIELYGESHVMKLNEFQEKAQKTNIDKYGVDNPMKNKEIQNKAKKTNLKKYGEEIASKSIEISTKISKALKKPFEDRFDYLLINSIKNSTIKMTDEYIGINEGYPNSRKLISYNFECKNCGHKFQSTLTNLSVPICRKCEPTNKENKYHQEIRDLLISIGIDFKENTKKIINPFELDFFIEDKKIAIEFNGNYWHSELGGGKDRRYHINKTKMCHKKGVKLIHIFEDEWINNRDIVKSRIKHYLGFNSNKIYARKCEIKEVSPREKNDFLNKNHIQGESKDSVKLGLYHKDELVSIMTFGKNRIALGNKHKENSWELIRFCSKINTSVVGSFSKLFKHFIKNFNPNEITSYADCRWTGIDEINNVYFKNGFKFSHISSPNYWYFKQNNYIKRYHRFKFRKQELLKIIGDENKNKKLSEWQIANLLKMDRIWDCGSMKFNWIK